METSSTTKMFQRMSRPRLLDINQEMLILNYQDYEVQIVDESNYSSSSANDPQNYLRQHTLNDYLIVSKHGIRLLKDGQAISSCLPSASGGATGIHNYSAVIIDNILYLAICNQVCALSLPKLDLIWHQAVDHATCFGVYYLEKFDCLICHGEIMISRITLDGKIVWNAGGKDIFTEGFEIKEDQIKVIDFNHEKYLIAVEDGRSTLLSG